MAFYDRQVWDLFETPNPSSWSWGWNHLQSHRREPNKQGHTLLVSEEPISWDGCWERQLLYVCNKNNLGVFTSFKCYINMVIERLLSVWHSRDDSMNTRWATLKSLLEEPRFLHPRSLEILATTLKSFKWKMMLIIILKALVVKDIACQNS